MAAGLALASFLIGGLLGLRFGVKTLLLLFAAGLLLAGILWLGGLIGAGTVVQSWLLAVVSAQVGFFIMVVLKGFLGGRSPSGGSRTGSPGASGSAADQGGRPGAGLNPRIGAQPARSG